MKLYNFEDDCPCQSYDCESGTNPPPSVSTSTSTRIGILPEELATDEECMSTAETDWDGNKMNWYAIDDETSGKTLIKKYRKKIIAEFLIIIYKIIINILINLRGQKLCIGLNENVGNPGNPSCGQGGTPVLIQTQGSIIIY